MLNSKQQLGSQVRAHRELIGLTQEQVAQAVGGGANRSIVAHLEQGLRLPRPEMLKAICEHLRIPEEVWTSYAHPDGVQRFDFEELLSELAGVPVSVDGHDKGTIQVVEKHIQELLRAKNSNAQARDLFNSILVFYGVRPTSQAFFNRYLSNAAFSSLDRFAEAIEAYQRDAVRLFSTLTQAFEELNGAQDLDARLEPLAKRSTSTYAERSDWTSIKEIPDARLPDLGYISAMKVRQETAEREALKNFLLQFAATTRRESIHKALQDVSEKQKRRMDSLLRKFDSKFPHGLFSPLFAPDADDIEREAQRLAPKSAQELERMESTQKQALENLAGYLSSDYLDVYVATSMRSTADFVSSNAFVRSLFAHPKIRPLKLRYFNPTQSWVDDRIAKGLVEAVMLRRASMAVYMAQKTDTFGKDSEASVALGQGKPVIVYVPKLIFPDGSIDTEVLFRKTRGELEALLGPEEKLEIDESVDELGLFAKILSTKLAKQTDDQLRELAKIHWADFDLMEEAERLPEQSRSVYRSWLETAISDAPWQGDFAALRDGVIQTFVANAVRFEQRARTFREIHPLALQVILSSGVLNGILVVRSVDQCALVLSKLVENDLPLDLSKDEGNYRLVERSTGSTIRVISRHRLLLHAFQTFYSQQGTTHS